MDIFFFLSLLHVSKATGQRKRKDLSVDWLLLLLPFLLQMQQK